MAGRIIYACCCLHNICINANDEPPESEDLQFHNIDVMDDQVEDIPHGDQWHSFGSRVREIYKNHLYNSI